MNTILFGVIFVASTVSYAYVDPREFPAKRCYRNAEEPNAYEQFMNLAPDLYNYAENTTKLLPQHIEHFCNVEQPILKTKLRDANKWLLKCMPQDEKFLPQLIQDTFDGLMDFLCINDGANVKSFFSTVGKDCRATLSRREVGECSWYIYRWVPLGVEHLTKDLVCRDIGFAKECLIGVLDRYCPNFTAFQELNKRFFEYTSKPCSACIFGVNNVVIFGCVLGALFYKKMF